MQQLHSLVQRCRYCLLSSQKALSVVRKEYLVRITHGHCLTAKAKQTSNFLRPAWHLADNREGGRQLTADTARLMIAILLTSLQLAKAQH